MREEPEDSEQPIWPSQIASATSSCCGCSSLGLLLEVLAGNGNKWQSVEPQRLIWQRVLIDAGTSGRL
eukprot:4906862-Amphidinium_carterae.1